MAKFNCCPISRSLLSARINASQSNDISAIDSSTTDENLGNQNNNQ
jgi:hypothetical protein